MPAKPDREAQKEAANAVEVDAETLALIVKAIKSLRFGAVEITVHDGRVVQLDKRERYRLKS